jgi:histidine ammonia-lyase
MSAIIHPSLSDLLRAAEHGTIPASVDLEAASEEISLTRTFIQTLLRQPNRSLIYGLNTLPGHRDGDEVSESNLLDLQTQIIRSHLVPSHNAVYTPYQSRCISVAKLVSLAKGGTGISELTFRWLSLAVQDPAFAPKIYENQSYSSGDVIPAAHWVEGLLQWIGQRDQTFRLAAGDAMALVNGNFVHAGLSLALVKPLRRCLALWSRMQALLLSSLGGAFHLPPPDAINESETFSVFLKFIESAAFDALPVSAMVSESISPQLPVSVRATAEILRVLVRAVLNHEDELKLTLSRKSGNPLYAATERRVYSQASFLAPELAIAQSALIEAILFSCGAAINQIEYVFSGEVIGVPLDGNRPHDKLGSIQLIKEMYSRLEYFRTISSRRLFSSSISTSKGIEDLCSFGEIVCSILSELIAFSEEIYSRIIILLEFVCQIFLKRPPLFFKPKINESDFLVDVVRGNELRLLKIFRTEKFGADST